MLKLYVVLKGAFCWFRSRDLVNIIPLHGTLKVKKPMVAFFSKNRRTNARPTLKVTLCLTFRHLLQISVSPANIFIASNATISGTEVSPVTVTVKTLATPLGYQSLVSLEAEIVRIS